MKKKNGLFEWWNDWRHKVEIKDDRYDSWTLGTLSILE